MLIRWPIVAKPLFLLLALVAAGIFASSTGASITVEGVGSPGNDDFSNATQIASLPFTDSVITVGASTEPGEPSGCGSMDKTVWYRISVDEPTTIAASTDGSDFTTSLAVYQGSSLAALSFVDCDQYDPGPPPPDPAPSAGAATANSPTNVAVAAELVPGSTYFIQAGGYQGASGEFQIDIYVTGVVAGRLFFDPNRNGEFDEGDSGIGEHPVRLTSASESEITYTAGDGSFQFTVPEGEYSLEADDHFASFLCILGGLPFNPVSFLDACVTPPIPRFFTSPNPQNISVPTTQTTMADIGVRTGDAMVLTGIALLEDGIAPGGTEVRALHGETECGTSEVIETGAHQANYELMVLGAGERAGCAQPGDTITIELGQAEADEALVYDPTPDSFILHPLMAIGDRAWFWAQEVLLPDAPVPSGQVEAMLNGAPCGVANLGTAPSFSQRVSGFSALVVEGESLDPACGGPGDVVSFRLNGIAIGTAAWQPGLNYVNLNLPGAIVLGDLDCSASVDQDDLLFALRQLGGLVANSECSPFASDMNCDMTFGGKDILTLLLWLAGLTTNQPDGCPKIGEAGDSPDWVG